MAIDRRSFLRTGSAVGGAVGPRVLPGPGIIHGLAGVARDSLDGRDTRSEREWLRALNSELDGIGVRREARGLATWHASRS